MMVLAVRLLLLLLAVAVVGARRALLGTRNRLFGRCLGQRALVAHSPAAAPEFALFDKAEKRDLAFVGYRCIGPN